MAPVVSGDERCAPVAAAIPLARAVLCLSCEVVYAQGWPACPACGHRDGWPLARWIDRRAA